MIGQPQIQDQGDDYQVQVIYQVEADQDYELFTALGYKIGEEDEWTLLEVQPTTAGLHTLNFESPQKPLEIQIDPEYRVPQINPDDNGWQAR